MKKIFALISALAVFSACALLSPYSITFTTPDGTVVNPQYNTLDFAVSAPTLAYISGVQCDDQEPVEILPVITDDMQVSNAHNLSLDVLTDQPVGAKCNVTVTAFDQTTTATSRKSITLYVLEMPTDESATDNMIDTEDSINEGDVEVCEDGTACLQDTNIETTIETTVNPDETIDTTTDTSTDSSEEESGT